MGKEYRKVLAMEGKAKECIASKTLMCQESPKTSGVALAPEATWQRKKKCIYAHIPPNKPEEGGTKEPVELNFVRLRHRSQETPETRYFAGS